MSIAMARSPLTLALTTGAIAALGLAASLATAQEAMEDAMKGQMMGGARVMRDAVFFRDQIQPILLQHCAGCHEAGDPDNETRHRLFTPEPGAKLTDDQVEKNYQSVVALLHPTEPARSRVLQKLVPLSWGGIDHDGGKADGDDFPFALIDPKGPLVFWVFGATKTARPPVAVNGPVPRNVAVGTEIRLDGTLSYDPDGDDVTLKWEIADAPLGAKARITGSSSTIATITPDRAGPWVIRMSPSDGKLGGWPRLIRFGAVRRDDAPRDTGPVTRRKISTQDRRITRSLYLDLWGRTPIEDELQVLCALPYGERVDQMLDDRATWKNWLDEEAFYFLLIDRFRPVSDRLAAVPDKMKAGTLNFQQAHVEFVVSESET